MQKEKHSKIYILGAGGMAREVLQLLEDLNLENSFTGFAVERKYFDQKKDQILGKRIFEIEDIEPEGTKLIAAIGSPLRRNWIKSLKSKGFEFLTLVHPSVMIDKTVEIGEGAIICKSAVLTNQIKIGDFAIINICSSISHNCEIGNFTTVSPGVTIGGDVFIGEASWIGIGATVIQKITIGKGVFLGAGAVVIEDIVDNFLAYGVPAKPVREITEADWQELI